MVIKDKDKQKEGIKIKPGFIEKLKCSSPTKLNEIIKEKALINPCLKIEEEYEVKVTNFEEIEKQLLANITTVTEPTILRQKSFVFELLLSLLEKELRLYVHGNHFQMKFQTLLFSFVSLQFLLRFQQLQLHYLQW